MGIRLFAFVLLGFISSNTGYAAPPACNAGSEGTIVYNKDQKLVQFCNGSSWIGMVATIGNTGDTLGDLNCSNGQIVKFNGTSWICAVDNGGVLPALT